MQIEFDKELLVLGVHYALPSECVAKKSIMFLRGWGSLGDLTGRLVDSPFLAERPETEDAAFDLSFGPEKLFDFLREADTETAGDLLYLLSQNDGFCKWLLSRPPDEWREFERLTALQWERDANRLKENTAVWNAELQAMRWGLIAGVSISGLLMGIGGFLLYQHAYALGATAICTAQLIPFGCAAAYDIIQA